MKHEQTRNYYDTNGGGNVWHKCNHQTKSLTAMYKNEKINETNSVLTTSAICGVKTEHTRLKRMTCEEFIISHRAHRAVLVCNLITAKGDPNGREIQIGLADRIR
jgi:hypothetical protein